MTAEEHRVDLPQGPICYCDIGTGPTLVFVHGIFVDSHLWDGVLDRLAGEFRCIVPDLPFGSHRLAMRPDADLAPLGAAALVADFIAALDLDQVTLVANNTGGAIAQMVAAYHPQRIGRLVLTPCDTYENFLPRMYRYLQVLAHVPGGLFVLAQSFRIPAVRRLPIAYGWLTKRPAPAELLERWVRPVISDRGVRRDTAKLLRGIRKRQTIEAAEALRRFDRPVLLAFAPEDRFFPYRHVERLSLEMPQARLARIDDSRSFASLDQPAVTAQLIRDFVTPV